MTGKTTTRRWARALGATLLGLLVSGVFVTRSLAATPPPTPTITAGPTGTVKVTTATFKWSVTNAPKGTTYACSLDNAAFTTCTSGISYKALTDGAHTFRVQSVLAGTPSTPAARPWAIDVRPPVPAPTFPTPGSTTTLATYANGCAVPGFCGTAVDATGVAGVTISLRQGTGNYWSGTSFSAKRETYLTATLGATGAASTTWSYPLASLPVGTYTVNIKSTDTLGTATATPVSASFTLVNPVTPPTITVRPTDPSPDAAPTFSFTGIPTGVGFRCSLDGGAAVVCDSGSITYSNLSPAAHCFSVVAVSAGANSTATSYCWNLVATVGGFTISGSPSATLTPGGTPQPIDLSITNPFPFAIKVLSIGITVDASTSRPGCNGPANLAVTRPFSGTATIPANSTKKLSELAPTVTADQWPLVQMIDATFDQNACKGASFTLTYTGTASQ